MYKLKPTFVERIKQAGEYPDGNGLLLVVGKNARNKSWFFKSRIKFNGQSKEIRKKFASYPAVSLSEARQIALEIKSSYQSGVDYFVELAKRDAALAHNEITLKVMAEKWLDNKVSRGNYRESTSAKVKERLEKYIYPMIGDKALNSIDTIALTNALQPLREKGTHDTAYRIAGYLSNIFKQAVVEGILPYSPAQYLTVAFPKPKGKHNPYIEIDKIPLLLLDIEKGLQFKLMDKVTHHMILIQLHTLARPGEIASLRWEYINFEQCFWTIPAGKMKNNVEHKQPLSRSVMELLTDLKLLSNHSEYVFPAAKRHSKSPHRNKETANNALKRLGYQGVLTAHGLRSTAGTALSKLGYQIDIIDKSLSHLVGGAVTRAYIKDDFFDKRREMLNHWSEYLEGLAIDVR